MHGDHAVWHAVCVCIRSRPRCTWMPDHASTRKSHRRPATHHRSSHVLAPSATKPSPRMKGCCRPRLTASCCCCCGCDSSPGVRVHTAHDNAPGIGTIDCARSQHAPPGHIGYPGLVFAFCICFGICFEASFGLMRILAQSAQSLPTCRARPGSWTLLPLCSRVGTSTHTQILPPRRREGEHHRL